MANLDGKPRGDKIACRESNARVQAYETRRCGTRVIWLKLDCLYLNRSQPACTPRPPNGHNPRPFISVQGPTTCAPSFVAGVPSQSSPSLTRSPGTDDLGHRRDQEKLTVQHLEHGEGLARVPGGDKVAVPRGGKRGEREEQVLGERAAALGPEERPFSISRSQRVCRFIQNRSEVGTDAALPVHNLIDPPGRDADLPRQLILAQR